MSHAETSKPIEGDPYEKRDVSMGWIIAATGVCIVTVVISVVLLDFYFDYYRDRLHEEMVLDRGHRLSNEAKAEAAAKLSGEAATPEGGKTISIDQAIEAISDDK